MAVDEKIALLEGNIAALQQGVSREEDRRAEFTLDLKAWDRYVAAGSQGRAPFGEQQAIRNGLVSIEDNIKTIKTAIERQQLRLLALKAATNGSS
jgi:hypothetical protein